VAALTTVNCGHDMAEVAYYATVPATQNTKHLIYPFRSQSSNPAQSAALGLHRLLARMITDTARLSDHNEQANTQISS
jgi:hypothetical protein